MTEQSSGSSALPRNLEMAKARGIPILTEAQKAALFEREDHGVTPFPALQSFKNFEDWKAWGGYPRNFWQRFADMRISDAFRALQCYQRFEVLYPELNSELCEAATKYADAFSAYSQSRDYSQPEGPGNPGVPRPEYDEGLDRKFFDGYQKLAALVDINDVEFYPQELLG